MQRRGIITKGDRHPVPLADNTAHAICCAAAMVLAAVMFKQCLN